jgi:hypothetical protein
MPLLFFLTRQIVVPCFKKNVKKYSRCRVGRGYQKSFTAAAFSGPRCLRIVDHPSFFLEHTYLPVHFEMSRICKAMKRLPLDPASYDFWSLFTGYDPTLSGTY